MTTPLTPDELAAIRARCEAATPGPWTLSHFSAKDTEDGDAETHIQCYADADEEEGVSLAWVNHWSYGDDPPKQESVANALFISRARTDVPRLLDEVERLRTAIRTRLDACPSCHGTKRIAVYTHDSASDELEYSHTTGCHVCQWAREALGEPQA